MTLIFHNKASCLFMVLFCFLIIQQSKAQSMRQNKTQLVPATSVAVLKSNFSRDETVKVVYHKVQSSIHNSISDDVLSQNITISGVEIINGKSNKTNFNQANATDFAKVEATSLINYNVYPKSKVSKTTISGVDLIRDKNSIIYPYEKQNLELLAGDQKLFIEDSLWDILSENRAVEFKIQQPTDETAVRLLAEEEENQSMLDSLAEAEQLVEFEAQRLAERSAAKSLFEEQDIQREANSLSKADQLAELEAQRLIELEQQRQVEEAALLAEQAENKRISDSLSKAEQLAELEAQRLSELEQQRQVEDTRLLEVNQLMQEQNKQFFVEKEPNSDANLSEMYTAPKVKYDEYYTIKLTSVYSPMEGISFLNNIRDGDEIWKDNAFHLYQDEYNSDLTNISIGKFSSLDEADIVINKLKNKGLTNTKAIKYTNKMKSNSAANSIKKKSVSNSDIKTTIVKPVKNGIVSKNSKNSNNFTNENKNIKSVNALKNISKEVNKDQDFFTIQLAAVSEITSDRINSVNLDKQQLFYQNINAGKYALNFKKFSNYGEAHTEAIKLHNQGFEGVYVAKYENNKRTSVTKSDLANDNVSESTISADLISLGYKPLDFNRNGKYIQIGSFYNWDSHSYKDSYELINHTIYYMIDQSHIVKFLIGPFNDRDLFIELRNVKKQINDAFIKNI